MDNENEIKKPTESNVRDLVEQSKLVFLQEIIDEFRRKQAQYDLAEEFAKTRKNRSPIVPLVVLGISLLFIGGAVAVTFYIQETSKRITVSIQEFEDINLKDVLDAAKRNGQELERAQRELDALNQALEGELQGARNESRRELDIIAADRISQEERDQKSRAVRDREAARIRQIRASYAPRIEAKQKELNEIQKKIDEYDARQLEKARQQEEVLNNQQRLYAIEMEKTTKYYEDRIAGLIDKHAKEMTALQNHQREILAVLRANQAKEIENLILKYNPKVAESAMLSLLDAPLDAAVLRDKYPGAYRDILAQEQVMAPADFARLERGTAEYDRVLGELKKIPYQNSVPAMIKQIEQRHRVILKQYESLWNGLSDTVVRKNEIIETQRREIERFLFAIEHFLKANRENGYIIDPRNPGGIAVYMDKVRSVTDGTVGLVFRKDDESVGKVRFFTRGGNLFASVIELENPDNPIQPFDKILIQEK